MSILRIILLSISLVFAWSSFLSANPYKARFLSEPVMMPAEDGMSILFAWVEFGPLVSQWDYESYCTPPPPFFVVVVDWLSPDDPTCWINVFMGTQAVCVGIRGGYIIRGQGHIWLDNSALPWNGWCITWPLICGMNHFRLEIGPLFPSGEGLPDGNYRISLISLNYFLWPEKCDPERRAWENWVFNLYSTDSREFQINGDLGGHSLETGLHYFGVARNDSIYNGGNLHVFSDYRLKCKVYSSKSEADMPETLIGELVPEGRRGIPITLERSPEEDEVSCDPDYPLSYFAYTAEDLINPVDLWPVYYDWDRTARQLSCNFGAEENDLDQPASIVVYVLANLNLDRLNDETECFIPVNCETMDFEFRFSEDLHLDDNSYINFIVRNGNYEWVNNTPLIFGDAHEYSGGNDWGIPDPPQMYTIPISWDGRDNQSPNSGHLVDPDLGPYQAYVLITDMMGPIMSNIEGFNVVPMIDSVLVTHHPFYPPTQIFPTTVYSVIRGKIDDSDDPSLDYRYYIPPPDPPYQNPTSLGFWKNENNSNYYKFQDFDGEKFYENNSSQTIILNEWDPEKFGELQYRWMAIKDQRIGTTDQVSYETVVDTTAQWGDTWDIELIRPWMWWRPETMPYMRILTYSIIDNAKNDYLLQGGISATGVDAHKLIFMDEWAQGPFDMPDWAVSHIGVPYTYGIKNPYISNDCGGFVTACRIEELGPGAQHDLSIDRLASISYYDHVIWYNGRIFTETVSDPRQDPDLEPGYRGLILFINEKDYEHPWDGHRHILIVEKMDFLEEYPNVPIPRTCRVLHARGGRHNRQLGRVRFEDAVETYAPYFDVEGYRDNEWEWTFLKFVD